MTNIKTTTVLLVVGLLALTLNCQTQAADGAAIASKGNTHGATACSTCHGADGQGNDAAGFPRLAGLNAAYLDQQLQDFAGGKRQNAIMMPIAKALSADEMTAVTKYYAGLPPPKTALKTDVKPDPVGQAIAQRGRWDQGVPGCEQCHGPDGMGVGETFPPLAGQSSTYISNQLHNWQQGTRPPGPLGLMPAVAKKLSDSEIDAVSNYFASLSPAAAGKGSTP